jgi:hypothetical protein
MNNANVKIYLKSSPQNKQLQKMPQDIFLLEGSLPKPGNPYCGPTDQQPTTYDQQPMTNNQQPTTNDQRPTTNNQ